MPKYEKIEPGTAYTSTGKKTISGSASVETTQKTKSISPSAKVNAPATRITSKKELLPGRGSAETRMNKPVTNFQPRIGGHAS